MNKLQGISLVLNNGLYVLDLISSFCLFVMNLAVYLTLLNQSKKKDRDTPPLTTAFLMSSIASFFAFLDAPLIGLTNYIPNEVFYVLQVLFFSLNFFYFYLHHEYLERSSPKLTRYFLTWFFFGELIGALVLHVWKTIFLDYTLFVIPEGSTYQSIIFFIKLHFYYLFDMFPDVAYYSLGVTAFYFSTISYLRIYRVTREKINLSLALSTFIVTFSLVGMLFIKVDYNIFNQELLGWGYWGFYILLFVISLATLLYGLVYLLNPDFFYRLPFSIYSLIIYQKNGLPIYSERFDTKIYEESELLLHAGLLTVIGAIATDLATLEISLKKIVAERLSIFLVSNDAISFAFIAEKSTWYFERSAHHFAKMFVKKYHEMGDELVNNRKMMRRLIKSAMPYIIFKD